MASLSSLISEQLRLAPASLSELVRTFAKVGCLSFGGPAAQIAWLHRIAVDEKRWVTEQDFLHALNYCMILPGPEAQQLATYIGWLKQGVLGGIVSGALFVIPGALVMLALSTAYALYADLAFLEAVFFGIKAAVLVIVVQAVIKIGKRALTSRFAVVVAAAAFLATALLGIPFPLIVIAAGLAGYAALRLNPQDAEPSRPEARLPLTSALAAGAGTVLAWSLPPLLALVALGPEHVLVDLAGFFSMLAVVTFGGAYAVLSYLSQAAVETFGWVTPEEMLDGFGLAETTPGPLILVNQFIGFLAAYREPAPFGPLTAGALGAAMTTWVTFAPSFLYIFLGAPFMERLRSARALNAALSAITAAVVGVILNLALWFAMHVLFAHVDTLRAGPFSVDVPRLSSLDPAALALGVIAGALVFAWKLTVPATVGIMAALGVAVRLVAG